MIARKADAPRIGIVMTDFIEELTFTCAFMVSRLAGRAQASRTIYGILLGTLLHGTWWRCDLKASGRRRYSDHDIHTKKLMLQSPPIELSVSRWDWNPVPGGKAVRDGRNSMAMGSRCQNLLIVEFDGVG